MRASALAIAATLAVLGADVRAQGTKDYTGPLPPTNYRPLARHLPPPIGGHMPTHLDTSIGSPLFDEYIRCVACASNNRSPSLSIALELLALAASSPTRKSCSQMRDHA
jgi:hypothetical protein